jgi:hypothetical protein
MEALFIYIENSQRIYYNGKVRSQNDVRSNYEDCLTNTSKDADKASWQRTFNLWKSSSQRKSVDDTQFAPGQPELFSDRGVELLNTYRTPSFPVGNPELAKPFFDHLDWLLSADPQGKEDFLDWLAHMFQKPQVRPHVHFLLFSHIKGNGKSTVLEILHAIWRQHAASVDLNKLIKSDFNSVLEDKMLMTVHEVKAESGERFSVINRLKSLLTDSDITINKKGIAEFTGKLYARFLMASNFIDAVPIDESDRRLYILPCTEEIHPDRANGYYDVLHAIKETPEALGAIHHTLMTRDISNNEVERMRAPVNDIKQEMIDSSRTEHQVQAAEFVKKFPYTQIAGSHLMAMLLPAEIIGGDTKKKVEAQMSRFLSELGVSKTSTKDRKKINGRREAIYFLRGKRTFDKQQVQNAFEFCKKRQFDLAHVVADCSPTDDIELNSKPPVKGVDLFNVGRPKKGLEAMMVGGESCE